MRKDFELPESHLPYTDKYFIRTRKILAEEKLNPFVTMQVFIREGPGKISGIEEAAAIIRKYSLLEKNNGRIFGLPEGSDYRPGEPVMHIEGFLQDIVELETMYLGAISSATTKANNGKEVSPDEVMRRAAEIRGIIKGKQLMYFGARHWHYSKDADISKAAVRGGFDSCSTDMGAEAAGLGRGKGVGTIPHALVIAFGEKYGKEKATVLATEAFDRHIEKDVPRIALVDTFNMEIDDSVAAAENIKGLFGVRLDTTGDVLGQGSAPKSNPKKYLEGKGVTVELARNVRKALDSNGFEATGIVLSSGFGNLAKLRAFSEAEKAHGRIFDSVGIGGLFESRFATADIVRANGKQFSKSGRRYTANRRMVRY